LSLQLLGKFIAAYIIIIFLSFVEDQGSEKFKYQLYLSKIIKSLWGVVWDVGMGVGCGRDLRGAAGGRVQVAVGPGEADVEQHGLERVAAHALLIGVRCATPVSHHACLCAAILNTRSF
jgi:hypothetical protein